MYCCDQHCFDDMPYVVTEKIRTLTEQVAAARKEERDRIAALLAGTKFLLESMQDNFNCTHEDREDPQDPHDGDYESCWQCSAVMALKDLGEIARGEP
jgi:hypothetical protein